MTGIRSLSGWLGIALDARDPRALAGFYSRLLGWPISSEDPTWVTIAMPGHPANLAFQFDPHHEPPTWPSEPGSLTQQLHLDLGVTDLEAAVADALELGARLAAHQPQEDVRVLLDPEGHPFCLYIDDEPPAG